MFSKLNPTMILGATNSYFFKVLDQNLGFKPPHARVMKYPYLPVLEFLFYFIEETNITRKVNVIHCILSQIRAPPLSLLLNRVELNTHML